MGLKDPGRDEDVRNELTSTVLELQEEGDVEGGLPPTRASGSPLRARARLSRAPRSKRGPGET